MCLCMVLERQILKVNTEETLRARWKHETLTLLAVGGKRVSIAVGVVLASKHSKPTVTVSSWLPHGGGLEKDTNDVSWSVVIGEKG